MPPLPTSHRRSRPLHHLFLYKRHFLKLLFNGLSTQPKIMPKEDKMLHQYLKVISIHFFPFVYLIMQHRSSSIPPSPQVLKIIWRGSWLKWLEMNEPVCEICAIIPLALSKADIINPSQPSFMLSLDTSSESFSMQGSHQPLPVSWSLQLLPNYLPLLDCTLFP